jgi:osmotically-inducible protein OsmY
MSRASASTWITVNGVVILKGNVDTQQQADRVVSVAKVAEGVKGVRNELTVKGTGGTK